jgi:tetratricopeptide (TPR) repeat protein
VGVVQFRPAPDFDRLRAVMQEDAREVIPQAKHFLDHGHADLLAQARTYNLLCYTSACILKRSVVEAVYHGHEAVRLSRTFTGLEGQQVLFDSLVNLGSAAERIGEYARAIEAYREALAMPLEWLGRSAHEEAVLTYLGRVHYYRGDYEDALTAFDQAGQIAGERQDPFANELLHSQRGMCYLKMDELDQAEQYLSSAAEIMNDETRYELRPKGQILSKLAICQFLRGNLAEAESYAAAALALAVDVEDPHGQVESQLVLAGAARARRRIGQAVALSAAACRIAFDYGYVPLIQEMTWLLEYLYPQENE